MLAVTVPTAYHQRNVPGCLAHSGVGGWAVKVQACARDLMIVRRIQGESRDLYSSNEKLNDHLEDLGSSVIRAKSRRKTSHRRAPDGLADSRTKVTASSQRQDRRSVFRLSHYLPLGTLKGPTKDDMCVAWAALDVKSWIPTGAQMGSKWDNLLPAV